MKSVFFIILFIIIVGFLYGQETYPAYLSDELIISTGIFNDNLLCTYEAAQQGLSWGPDDIYTFGAVLKGIYRRCLFGFDYSSITSRKFLYRFDYVKISTLYSIPLQGTGYYTLGGGLSYIGRFLGEDIQNGFHTIISYPRVNIPYLEQRFSGFIRGGVSVDFFTKAEWGVLCQLYCDSEVFIPEGLHNGKIGLSFLYSTPIVDLEAISGVKACFSLPDYFDQLLRTGFYGGILLTFKIPPIMAISAAVGGFPVQNALDDPSFVHTSYPYMPQIQILMSYGKKSIPIRELFTF